MGNIIYVVNQKNCLNKNNYSHFVIIFVIFIIFLIVAWATQSPSLPKYYSFCLVEQVTPKHCYGVLFVQSIFFLQKYILQYI